MKTLITGGAGFIGVNLAAYLLGRGDEVVILDNLSRPGSEKNLAWLQKTAGDFSFLKADIQDQSALVNAVKGKEAVFHLAAQVAVTSSVTDPITDFEINARGTINLLEAARQQSPETIFIFASTNKVYGRLEYLALQEEEKRYSLREKGEGISEEMLLDFHSPYGCSKGAADQYVRDYHRIYGLKTVVFRQSCIYGEHQFGNEDQGWVAHLMRSALEGRPITIYGDGKQVRDLLWVGDLIAAFLLACQKIEVASGQIYNIGGGLNNTLSLLELLNWLEQQLGHQVPYCFAGWRPGDQKVYISDIRKVRKELSWKPEVVAVPEGLNKLLLWLKEAV